MACGSAGALSNSAELKPSCINTSTQAKQNPGCIGTKTVAHLTPQRPRAFVAAEICGLVAFAYRVASLFSSAVVAKGAALARRKCCSAARSTNGLLLSRRALHLFQGAEESLAASYPGVLDRQGLHQSMQPENDTGDA